MDLGIALGIAGVALSIIAILLAISPFAQMIWGRPKLRFTFDELSQLDFLFPFLCLGLDSPLTCS